MSQSSRRNRGSRGNRSSGSPSKRPQPDVVRQPVSRVPQRPTSRVGGTLPPFSTRRYLVIWLAGLVPLAIIFFLLLRPPAQTPPPSTPTPAANNASGAFVTQTPAPSDNPVVTQMAGSAAPGTTAAPGVSSSSTSTAGKYFVVETTKGRIVAKLYNDASAGVSKTIANFEQKANSGYFNGLTFHRVEDWVIQGGDPLGNGTGGKTMPSEYNQIPFKVGALGVARGPDPAINNDSQFFIVKADADNLDGQYTNWGQVVEGMDVVNQIAIGDKMTKVTVENRP
jgi:peptidyl-prolyl cis-trans isomerase B (cyclophilin B)